MERGQYPTSLALEPANVSWSFAGESIKLSVPLHVDPVPYTLKERIVEFINPIIVTLLLIVLAYLSTRPHRDILFVRQKLENKTVNAVPTVPYWIPYLGHIIPFSYDCDALLKSIRDKFCFDVFALKLAGSRHYMVNSPYLVGKVLTKKEKDVAYAVVMSDLVHSFGLHPRWRGEFAQHLPNFQRAIITGLMREPGLSNVVRSVVQNTAVVLPRLISSSIRTSEPGRVGKSGNTKKAEIAEPNGCVEAAEVDLFPLIRDAIGHCANPAVMGKQFLKDYPTILEDLWAFDDAFLPLVSGIPAWAPIPCIRRSVKARDRIIQNLLSWASDYRRSFAGDLTGKDFSDVSEVMRQVIKMLDATTIDYQGSGSIILIVFWALNANANNLAFWLIIRIAADADLLSRIRSEISPHIQTQQVNPASLADLQISIEGLMSSCPLLKATYLECNRLHSRPISIRTIANDVVLTDDNNKPSPPTSHLLQKNSYLYIPHFLHHMSPQYFSDPETFRPERFLTFDPDGKINVDAKTLRPYGGGTSMCKGRYFAEREVLAFVAGFFALWDIEDVHGYELKVPGNVKSSATAKPDGNCRVRIRRRRDVG